MDKKMMMRLASLINFETRTFNHDKFISAFSLFLLAHKNKNIPRDVSRKFKVDKSFLLYLNLYLHLLDDPDEDPECKADEVSFLVEKIIISCCFFVEWFQHEKINVKTFDDLAMIPESVFRVRRFIRKIATHTSLSDAIIDEFELGWLLDEMKNEA